MSAADHRAAVQDNSADALTVGKVQREIRVGMTNAEVAEVLGSPNIVTTDELRREVWVYDKIATEQAYSTSTGGVSSLVLVGALVGNTLLGGLGGGNYSQSAGASSTTQKTLTIIIKFDEAHKVRDFAYHSSKF
jgi:outer membrane protein assembly factor BamE (lipoprotein component of BamABCDE complex)